MLKVSRSLFARKAKSTGLEKRNLLEQEALEASKSDTDLSSEEPDEIIPSENSTDSSDYDEEGGDEKPKSKGEKKEVKEKTKKGWGRNFADDNLTDTEIEDDDEFKEHFIVQLSAWSFY